MLPKEKKIKQFVYLYFSVDYLKILAAKSRHISKSLKMEKKKTVAKLLYLMYVRDYSWLFKTLFSVH